MVKVRLWGESAEIEELIARICNELPGVRVLSVSGHYKDRGASVYERCYLDVAVHEQIQTGAGSGTGAVKLPNELHEAPEQNSGVKERRQRSELKYLTAKSRDK